MGIVTRSGLKAESTVTQLEVAALHWAVTGSGNPYTGMWGYSYKLHGLDSTNSNAFERTVVLHSHRCVPDESTDDEICQSNGCPTVAPGFLAQLKSIINNSIRPVLLWIYQ